MEAEETFNFSLGSGIECAGCKELQRVIDKHKEEKQLSFKTLKQKIISTDQLIKQYNAKREEYDQQSKMLEDITRKLERSKRDTEMLEGQLQSALQQLEPLKKNIESLNITLKHKDTDIGMLNDKLQAADMLRAQFEAAARAHQAERSQIDRSDKEKKTLNKKIESLETAKEKLEKDLCKFKDANKLLKNENKTLQKNLDRAMKTSSNMVFVGGSPSSHTRGRKKGFLQSPSRKEKLPFSCGSGTENELSDAVGIMDAGSSSEDEINFDIHFALSPLSKLLSPLPPTPHDLTLQEEEVIQVGNVENPSDGHKRLSDSESGEEDDEAIDEDAAALEELITDLLPDTEENDKLKSVDGVQSVTEITCKSEDTTKISKSPIAADKRKISYENSKLILPTNSENSETTTLDGVPYMMESGLVVIKDKPKSSQVLTNQTHLDNSLNEASSSTEFSVELEDSTKTLQTHLIQTSADKPTPDCNKFEINKDKSSQKQAECPPQYVGNNQLSESQSVYSVEETKYDFNEQKAGIVKEHESAHKTNLVQESIPSSSSVSVVESVPVVANQIEDSLKPGVSSVPLFASESPSTSPSDITLKSSITEAVAIKNENNDRKPPDLRNSQAMCDGRVTEIFQKKENENVSIIPDKENEIILVVPNKESKIIPKKENEAYPKEKCVVKNGKNESVLSMENKVIEPAVSIKETLACSKSILKSASEKTQLQSNLPNVNASGVYPEDDIVDKNGGTPMSSNASKTLTQENNSLEEVGEKISINATTREASSNISSSSNARSNVTMQESENKTPNDAKQSNNAKTSDQPDSNEFQLSQDEKLAHLPDVADKNKEPVRTDIRGGDASCSSVGNKDIINIDHSYSNIHETIDSSESLLKSEISKSHIDHSSRNTVETEQNHSLKDDSDGSVVMFNEPFSGIESKVEITEDSSSSERKQSKPDDVSVTDENITAITESTERDGQCREPVEMEMISTENNNSENIFHKPIVHIPNINTQSTPDCSNFNDEQDELIKDKSVLVACENHMKTETGCTDECPNKESEVVETAPDMKNEMSLKMDSKIVPKKEETIHNLVNEIARDNKKEIINNNNENEIVRNNKKEIVLNTLEENEVISGIKNNHQDRRDQEEKLNKNESIVSSSKPQSVCLPLDNNNCTEFTKVLSLSDNTTTRAKSSDEDQADDQLVNDKSLSHPEADPARSTLVKKRFSSNEKPAVKDPKDSETEEAPEVNIVKIDPSKVEVNDLEKISDVKETNGSEESILEEQQSIHQYSVPSVKGSQDAMLEGVSGEVSEAALQEINLVKPTNSDTGHIPLKNISESSPASSTTIDGSGVESAASSMELSKKGRLSQNESTNVMDLGNSATTKESSQTEADNLIQKDEQNREKLNVSSRTTQLNSESNDLIAAPQQEISRIQDESATQVGNIRLCKRIAHVKKDVTKTEDNNSNPIEQSLSDPFDTDTISSRRKKRKAKKRKRKDVKEEMIHKSPKFENMSERCFNSDVNSHQDHIQDSSNSEVQASPDPTDQQDKGFGKKPVMVTQRSTGFLMSGADLLMNATKKHPDSNSGKQNSSKSKNKSMIGDASGFPPINVDLPSTSKASIDRDEEFSSMDDFLGIFTLPTSPFDMLDMLHPISPLPPSPDITDTQVMDDICLTSFSEPEVTKNVTLNGADVKMLPSFSDTNANSSIIKPSPIHPMATSAASKILPQTCAKSSPIIEAMSNPKSSPPSNLSLNHKTFIKSTGKETVKEVLSEHSPLTVHAQEKSFLQVSLQKDTKTLDELPQSAAGNKVLTENTPCRMITRRKSKLSSQIDSKKATNVDKVKASEPNGTYKESDIPRKQSLHSAPVTRSRADSGEKTVISETEYDVGKEKVASALPIQKHETDSLTTSDGSDKCLKGSSISSTQGPPEHVDKVRGGSAAGGLMKSNSANKGKKVICLSNTEVCELSENRSSKRKIVDISISEFAGSSSKSFDEISGATEPTTSDKISKRKSTEDIGDILSKKLKIETPQNDSCKYEVSASFERNPHSLKEDLIDMIKNGTVVSFLDKHFSADEERTGSWRKVMLLIHEFLKDVMELVSYENVSSKNKTNMLDCEEHICVLINRITADFKECGVDMLLDILWTSSTEDGLQTPAVLSMVRMYTAICRLKGDLELARVLLYHIILNVTDKNRLVNQILVIVGVWPLVLEKDFPKGSIMAHTLQHAILKLRMKLDVHGTRLLMKICAICNWPSDLPLSDNTRMLEKIIQYLKDHDNESEKLFEGKSSLKLLLLGEEWMFIFQEFIQRHVSSVCQRWASKSGQGSDVVYVESILCVLADILIPRVNPDFQHIKMILQTYLAPALNTSTPITSVTDCIASVIMKLSPFAHHLSMVTLLKWFKKHKAVLPAPLKAQLRQTRHKLMENFPDFKCGDFV